MPNDANIPIRFPVHGVHRGAPANAQPEGSTSDLLNVRAVHYGDRVGGGKRPGTVKESSTQIGSASNGRRINHLQLLRFAQTIQGCSPAAWETPGNGLNTNGNRLLGWNPTTKVHVLGDFTTLPAAAERFGIYDTILDTWTLPAPSFDTSMDWPCGMVAFDAGAGEKLYAVGGSDSSAAAKKFAAWNGTSWDYTVSGSGFAGGLAAVYCICVFNGSIYVAGAFTTANGVTVNSIARWTGTTFAALGVTGVTGGSVYAMEVYNGALYVAGSFTAAGGVANTNRLARWTGSAWQAVCTTAAGLDGDVYALRTWTIGTVSKLYIGGKFSAIDSVSYFGFIGSYDGTSFATLSRGLETREPSGTDKGVYSMEVYNNGQGDALWVAGFFQRASGDTGGGVACPNLAFWTGAEWRSLKQGFNFAVRHMIGVGNTLFKKLWATGKFTWRNVTAANGLAAWDGKRWESIGGAGLKDGGTIASPYKALCRAGILANSFGISKLFIASTYVDSNVHGFGPDQVDNAIAAWNGSKWEKMGDGVAGGGVAYGSIWDDGVGRKLFVTGAFTQAGTSTASPKIASWDGAIWEDLGTGLQGGNGYGLFGLSASSDLDGLYAGGTFTGAGGVANTNKIARWNGSTWNSVFAGAFTGTAIHAFTWFDDKLIIAGKFTQVNGVAVNAICSWDGATLAALGTGITGGQAEVRALAVYNDVLYAVGSFTTADAVTVNSVAAWDGSAWAAVGNGCLLGGAEARVDDCMVLQDFDGPALFVCGNFDKAGAATRRGIARYNFNTAAWGKVDNQTRPGLHNFSGLSAFEGMAMDVFNGRLIVTGNMAFVSGTQALYIAKAKCGTIDDQTIGQDPGAGGGGGGGPGGETGDPPTDPPGSGTFSGAPGGPPPPPPPNNGNHGDGGGIIMIPIDFGGAAGGRP